MATVKKKKSATPLFKGPFDTYFQLLVNTEKAEHCTYTVGKGYKLRKTNLGTGGDKMGGGLVNVFTVTVAPDPRDVPMHG